LTLIKLDHRLENDCIKLGYLFDSLVLLMDNALFPWLILVPAPVGSPAIDEFDLLPRDKQIALLDQSNQLAAFLRKYYPFDKLNIATIGNIVRQIHIHIVARSEDDTCWPAVVWGQAKNTPWQAADVDNLIDSLAAYLPKDFQKTSV